MARVIPAKMVLGSPSFTAMVPTARALKTDAPKGPDHVSPPSVDLYRPTPASQPLPQALASPVPTQRVFPVGSFGSNVMEPTEFIANEEDR